MITTCSNRITLALTAAFVAYAAGTTNAGVVDIDFSDEGGGTVYNVVDGDAGAYTITYVGSPRNQYDSDRGGGFRSNSGFGDNDQTVSFTISGLAAGFEVTDFGVGYVEADISSPNTTWTLTIDVGGPTLNTLLGVDGPSPNAQTNNDMFGVAVGNYGNAPTFNIGIGEDAGNSADALQINGLTVAVSAVIPAPAALPAGLAMLGLVAMRRRRMK